MKISEILVERVVGELKARGFDIVVDQHAIDRAADRLVIPNHVDDILEKLNQVEKDIEPMGNGNMFFLVDQGLQISLGIRKLADKKLLLKTVINTAKPYHRGVDDVLFVN